MTRAKWGPKKAGLRALLFRHESFLLIVPPLRYGNLCGRRPRRGRSAGWSTEGVLGARDPGEGERPSRAAPEVVKLKLDPYDGPKSFHASRAFAQYQADMLKMRSRRKFGFLLVALVLGTALLAAAIMLASQLL